MNTGLVMAAAVALLLAFIFALPQPGSKARNGAIAPGCAVHGARVFDGVRVWPTARGTIAPGAHADLLLVRGDPTTDIRASRDIVSIWKNGTPVQRRRYPTDSR